MKNTIPACLLLGLLFLPSAEACPVCDQETGKQVRASIFNRDFAHNVLVTLLPFPIFLGIVAAIHGFPARKPTAPGPSANQPQLEDGDKWPAS